MQQTLSLIKIYLSQEKIFILDFIIQIETYHKKLVTFIAYFFCVFYFKCLTYTFWELCHLEYSLGQAVFFGPNFENKIIDWTGVLLNWWTNGCVGKI